MFYKSSNNFEYNDCIARGACSVSPAVSSIHEVMLILLRQVAYYLLKLKNYGITKEEIVRELIYQVAFIDAAKDFSEVQILTIFSKHYRNLIELRKEYLQTCKLHEDQCHDIRHLLKFSSKTSLSYIMKKGDKEFINKYKKLSSSQKTGAEILSAIMKSVCVNLIRLYEFECSCEFASDNVLEALNIFNSTKIYTDTITKYTEILSKIDIELLKMLKQAQENTFGAIAEVSVSTSTIPNKAILVSGSNLKDLKNVLEYVKNTEIDVYTNGNLLIAHAYPHLKSYKNLKGHFGSGTFSTILDFATFPGAILLTKNEAQNIEYLYRGRLFTTDDIAPKGVVKIVDNNFSPLVDSALQAKGFAKGQNRESITIGIDMQELEKFINKINSADYEKLLIIGNSNLSLNINDYLKKLFSIIPDNWYAISFSYNPELDNVFSINLCNDYAQIYGVLQKLFEKIPYDSNKLVFFFTKCDINSFSGIINLKNEGVKNIFLSDCPPMLINPSVLSAFNKEYKIKQISTPDSDLKILD